MADYRVITKPGCPHCIRAKQALTIRGIAFVEDLRVTPEQIEAFKAEGFRTFPQVFDELGILIGTADQLEDYLEFAA